MNNLLKTRTTVAVKQYTYSSMGLLIVAETCATFACKTEQSYEVHCVKEARDCSGQ